MSLRLVSIILLFLSVFIFTSCGKKSSPDLPHVQQEQNLFGTFRSSLRAVNPSVSGANGTSQVRIQDDIFHVRVYLRNAQTVTHIQHIHSGTRCPTSDDDTNHDGIIDVNEAEAVYGPVLFSIDDRLSSLDGGAYPESVDYDFDQSATLSEVLDAYRLSSLDVQGKVVDVHGVQEGSSLPEGMAPDSLPVACGIYDH